MLSVADIHVDLTVTSAYQLEYEKVAKCFQFNISVRVPTCVCSLIPHKGSIRI